MAGWYESLQKSMSARRAFVETRSIARVSADVAPLVTASLGTISVRDRARKQRMIILPARGVRAPEAGVTGAAARTFLTGLTVGVPLKPTAGRVSATCGSSIQSSPGCGWCRRCSTTPRCRSCC